MVLSTGKNCAAQKKPEIAPKGYKIGEKWD